jgi:DNA-binding CsgD family transcriptional regulator
MRHFNESIAHLVGGNLSLFFEMLQAPRRPLIVTDRGWPTPSGRDYMLRFLVADNLNSALFKRILDAALARQTGLQRHQILTDREWYDCAIYEEYMTPTLLDAFLLSVQPVPAEDTFYLFFVQRVRGDRPFPQRAAELASLCLRELARSGGARLAGARDPSIEPLSPRLRQVLGCLLEGDGERQIARRLALSCETVHQYVKMLYRHFRISSRAELLSFFLSRSGLRLDLLCQPSSEKQTGQGSDFILNS